MHHCSQVIDAAAAVLSEPPNATPAKVDGSGNNSQICTETNVTGSGARGVLAQTGENEGKERVIPNQVSHGSLPLPTAEERLAQREVGGVKKTSRWSILKVFSLKALLFLTVGTDTTMGSTQNSTGIEGRKPVCQRCGCFFFSPRQRGQYYKCLGV